MPTATLDDYADLIEAASVLNVHPQSVRRLIKQSKLPFVLFAGKYLIERTKLQQIAAGYNNKPGRRNGYRRLL